MTQKCRKHAKNSVGKYFFKLLNKFCFGYNCRINLGNYAFELICNENEKLTYMQKYNSIFDRFLSSFMNSRLFQGRN